MSRQILLTLEITVADDVAAETVPWAIVETIRNATATWPRVESVRSVGLREATP